MKQNGRKKLLLLMLILVLLGIFVVPVLLVHLDLSRTAGFLKPLATPLKYEMTLINKNIRADGTESSSFFFDLIRRRNIDNENDLSAIFKVHEVEQLDACIIFTMVGMTAISVGYYYY